MSVEFVTGKLGSGKSLYIIRQIQERLRKGLRVATNIDLYPEYIVGRKNRNCPIRLPDRPRLADLEMLGRGCEDYNEKQFGLLVLDECSHFLNARTWNDKERAQLINWFTMARKKRWDVRFLVQDINMIDKQVRDALCQYLVVCRDMSSVKILKISLPKSHLVLKFFGDNTNSVVVDRHFFRAAELYKGYDTSQEFSEDLFFPEEGEPIDMRAAYSQLSAWHVYGRYYQPVPFSQKCYQVADLAYRGTLFAAVHIAGALTWQQPETVARNWNLLRD